jgi:excinuclease ABC subunit A
VLEPIRADLLARCELLEELGLGYLTLDRPAPGLSRGEAQRLRLLPLALGELRGLLLVLDEPSAGLHPQEVGRLITVLKRLRDQGQTVVVVEHDAVIARSADWLIDLGPGPGRAGGRLLWSGPPAELLKQPSTGEPSPTQRWLRERPWAEAPAPRRDHGWLRLEVLTRHNLQNLDVELGVGALTVVSGVSGAGKTSLLQEVVARFQAGRVPGSPFRRIVMVDAEPIGRTPRSNAATYTGAFDFIRDRFAATPEASAQGLGKGHFSFNTAGGRCEACEGAGVQEVGMRYLGTVDRVCEACGGRRFHGDVLGVKYRGRTIADVMEASIAEAAELFADHPKLARILKALEDVGLGYLTLGQPATTLSGGEAQRVKLATELAKAASGPALIVLDEPTTGLHALDIAVLLAAWERLLAAGHTLLVADNDLQVVRSGDRVLDLGPGGGPDGGRLVASGSPERIAACPESATGAALRGEFAEGAPSLSPVEASTIALQGVRTHNLQGFDLAIPAQGLTVVTGPSGSGKSSLVFDTLLAEAQNRFADLVSPWARRLLPRKGGAELDGARGLQATIAVPQHSGRRNPRSTVGTVTELDELFRLLFARAGMRPCPACGAGVEGERCACGRLLPALWAADFSPQGARGACPGCKGLGFLQRCDPERLVSHPELPLDGGAMDGTRFGAYLGEAEGQFIATFRHAAALAGLEVHRPWRELSAEARALAMAGTGDEIHEVAWRYRRGKVEGVHVLRTPWAGFANLVDREYERIHGDPKGEELEALLVDRPCAACDGERLKAEFRAVRFAGLSFPELLRKSVQDLDAWLDSLEKIPLSAQAEAVFQTLRADLSRRLQALREAGLGYLSLSREMASLSGGEAQRVRLAASLTGGLVGVTYVLDEPTRGLHPRDIQRLGGVLRSLTEAGNAVVLVEHEPTLIASADHLIELGPGAGPEGGRLLAVGTPRNIEALPHSRTGALLRRRAAFAEGRVRVEAWPEVRVRGARLHNLCGVEVAFPVGALVAVTGVSGSGKSTLVLDVLAPSLRGHLQGWGPVGCEGIDLPVAFAAIISADQEALGLGGTSTVLTLLGLAEPLRKRLAATPQAKALKLSAKHFSTSSPGGRCEACEGRGVITVAMDLLPDVTVGCETCQGQRFAPEVLACRLAGQNIAELLDASVADLATIFAADRLLHAPLGALVDVGLGYLTLGQEGRALSEGERQRLRLAGLLAKPSSGASAILLDEPTRGLGFEDVDRLRQTLQGLAQGGHLVVAITHDPAFIAACDWVIDLGPEGGDAGGRVLVAGPPEAVAACEGSHTGRALMERMIRG